MKRNKRIFSLRLFLKIIRLPLLLVFLGLSFIAMDYVDDLIPITWPLFFAYNGKIGKILLILSLLVFIYKFTGALSKRIEKRLYEEHRISSIILTTFRKAFAIALFFIAINVTVALLSPTQSYLTLIENITRSLFIIAMGLLATQVINMIEAIIYQRLVFDHTKNYRAQVIQTKTRILKNIAIVLIALLTLGILLMSFHSVRNLGVSVLASAGFLTAIIGLAAQKPLSSIFSGLQIALSQIIKIGDYVVVEGQSGIIEELTLSYVVIKLGDRRRLVVPISTFVDNPFENWSRENNGIQNSVYLNVDYRVPTAEVRRHLNEILNKSKYWNGITNVLCISNLNEKSVQIRIQVSAANSSDLYYLMNEIREKMLLFLQKNYSENLPILQ